MNARKTRRRFTKEFKAAAVSKVISTIRKSGNDTSGFTEKLIHFQMNDCLCFGKNWPDCPN